MPVYRYQAIVGSVPSSGFITADTAAGGRSLLRKRGLTIRRFAEHGSKTSNRSLQWPMLNRFGGGGHALNEATHYLAMLLRAGVPLGEALSVLVRQTPRSLEPVLRRVAEKVNAGSDFAQSLSEEPQVFDAGFVGVVRVGQASGQLEQCLQRLIQLRRRRQQLRQRVAAAMAYPAIVTAVGLGVVTFLLTFVVPKITSLISQSDRGVPLPTQVLLLLTDAIRGYWWIVVLIVTGAVLAAYLLDRRRLLIAFFVRLLMRMPILGTLLMKSGIAQASAMLETMLRSSLPLDEAIEITRRSTGNPVLRDEFNRMLTALRSGRPLVETTGGRSVLPPVVVHVLSIGEQTGQLEEMLGELAETFDADVEIAARQAVSILEPVLIIAISIVVGFIVLATILPIVRISGSF